MNSSIGFVSVSSISIYDRSLALMEQPILPGCLTVRDRGAVTCRSPGPPARSRPPRMAEGDGFLYTFGRLTSCLSATLTIWLSGCSLSPSETPRRTRMPTLEEAQRDFDELIQGGALLRQEEGNRDQLARGRPSRPQGLRYTLIQRDGNPTRPNDLLVRLSIFGQKPVSPTSLVNSTSVGIVPSFPRTLPRSGGGCRGPRRGAGRGSLRGAGGARRWPPPRS